MSRPRAAERDLDTSQLLRRGDYSINVAGSTRCCFLRRTVVHSHGRAQDGASLAAALRTARAAGRPLDHTPAGRVSRPRTAEWDLDTSLLLRRGDYSINVAGSRSQAVSLTTGSSDRLINRYVNISLTPPTERPLGRPLGCRGMIPLGCDSWPRSSGDRAPLS